MMTQEQIADIKALEKRIKDQGYSSICFLLVAYSIGGGTRYFIDLATAIAKYTTLTVYMQIMKAGTRMIILNGILCSMFITSNLIFMTKYGL